MGTSLNGLTPAGTYPGLIKTGDNAPIDGTLKTLSDGNGNNLPMQASTTAVNFTGTLTQAGATLQPTLVSGTNIKTINGTSLLGSGNIPVVTSPSGVAGAIQFSNGSAFASDASNLFWDDTNNRLGVGTNAPTALTHIVGNWQSPSLVRQWFKLTETSTGNTFGIVPSQVGLSNVGYSFQINEANEIVGRVGQTLFGTNLTGGEMTARVGIRGNGSTSATTSLLVQNSGGTELFKVRDDGAVNIGGNTSIAKANLQIGSEFEGNLNFTGINFANWNGTVFSRMTGNDPTTARFIHGGTSIDASASMQIDSTIRGFLPPRMTTTQRDAIATPATGLKVYNTTTNTTDTYDGTTWQRFGQQTFIKGSGSTSATNSLLVQNSSGTTLMSIADNGAISIGANNVTTFSGTVVNPVGPIQALNFANAGNPFNFGTASVYAISGTTPVVTSGQRDGFLGEFTFAPTSGTAILNVFNVSPTINQTGGANGITRGLYINPTLTAAADFRAIETTAGKIIFGGLPTSSAGLVSGQIWNDAGTIKIV